MALAHLIGEEGYGDYTKFFRSRSVEGDYIIMDNVLIETRKAMEVDELLRRGCICSANEIILTDVYRDKSATTKAVLEALWTIGHGTYGDTFKYMIVPQGNTLVEWVECACDIINKSTFVEHIHCIGVPKVLVDIAGRDGRLLAIKELRKQFSHWSWDIHLLGCWRNTIEIMHLEMLALKEEIPTIRGVDSAIAYVYARAGLSFEDDDRPDSLPIDFKDGSLSPTAERLLERNIKEWQYAGALKRRPLIHRIFDFFT
jgi:hypothetical protein